MLKANRKRNNRTLVAYYGDLTIYENTRHKELQATKFLNNSFWKQENITMGDLEVKELNHILNVKEVRSTRLTPSDFQFSLSQQDSCQFSVKPFVGDN